MSLPQQKAVLKVTEQTCQHAEHIHCPQTVLTSATKHTSISLLPISLTAEITPCKGTGDTILKAQNTTVFLLLPNG